MDFLCPVAVVDKPSAFCGQCVHCSYRYEAKCPQPAGLGVWSNSVAGAVHCCQACALSCGEVGRTHWNGMAFTGFALCGFLGGSRPFGGCQCHLRFSAVWMFGWASLISPCCGPLNLKGWGQVSKVRKGNVALEEGVWGRKQQTA